MMNMSRVSRFVALAALTVGAAALVRAAAPADTVDVKIEEWLTPSKPPYPLDPNAPDGAINLVSPPTANARPYGIVLNSKEVPFFDEFNAPNIGSVDPKTLKITEYPLPDKGARPRRIAIARDDTVYYTYYARGFFGRLNPATGKVEEFASPGGPDSKPYAVGITSDGGVWYVETGDDTHNVLVRFNPETKKMQTFPIPGGGGTVRNLDIAKGDVIWLAESGVGKIARVTIKSAASTQYSSSR